MKKLVLAVMLIGILVAGNVWAYTNFREAFDAGYKKLGDANYESALLDFQEALTLTTEGTKKSDAQRKIAGCYQGINNLSQARIEWVKVLGIDGGWLPCKIEAWNALLKLEIEYKEIVSLLADVKDWSGYFYRAKAKEMLKDWIGAKADYESAISLVGDDIENRKIVLQALTNVVATMKSLGLIQ